MTTEISFGVASSAKSDCWNRQTSFSSSSIDSLPGNSNSLGSGEPSKLTASIAVSGNSGSPPTSLPSKKIAADASAGADVVAAPTFNTKISCASTSRLSSVPTDSACSTETSREPASRTCSPAVVFASINSSPEMAFPSEIPTSAPSIKSEIVPVDAEPVSSSCNSMTSLLFSLSENRMLPAFTKRSPSIESCATSVNAFRS